MISARTRVGILPRQFDRIWCCVDFFFYKFFIYLFLVALGLQCCSWAFSRVVLRLPIAMASLLVEHGATTEALCRGTSKGTRRKSRGWRSDRIYGVKFFKHYGFVL